MAVGDNQQQVLWGGAASKSIAAGGTDTCDTITFSSNAWEAQLTLKADNDGTPADGDKVVFYIKYSTGDPDADPDSADEFDTDGHAFHLATLDTFKEDHAQVTITKLSAAKSCQIKADNNGASGITVSAEFWEKTA